VANPVPDRTVQEDAPFTYALRPDTFADADVGDTLTLSAGRADGSALPAWLSFDAVTGTFSGTPANADVGSISVKVTATDAAGATAASTFTLTIANVNDAPTVASPPAGQSATEDAHWSYTLPVG